MFAAHRVFKLYFKSSNAFAPICCRTFIFYQLPSQFLALGVSVSKQAALYNSILSLSDGTVPRLKSQILCALSCVSPCPPLHCSNTTPLCNLYCPSPVVTPSPIHKDLHVHTAPFPPFPFSSPHLSPFNSTNNAPSHPGSAAACCRQYILIKLNIDGTICFLKLCRLYRSNF